MRIDKSLLDLAKLRAGVKSGGELAVGLGVPVADIIEKV